jgi:glycosyltransferase involved in cell wall biosynthesis
MRTMIVSHRLPPEGLGGVEQYSMSLARELQRCGDTVSLVARMPQSKASGRRMLKERLPEGAVLYRLAGPRHNPEHFLSGQEEVGRLFLMAASEFAPDVVHVNHLMGFSPQIIHSAHRLGAAVVISLHDFYLACPRVHLQKPSGQLCNGPALGRECAASCFPACSDEGRQYWGLRAMYFRRALAIVDSVIAYSQHVASYFQPLSEGPIHVIPNGVPPECIPEENEAESLNIRAPLTLAYCGTVAPHKGAHLILEALRIARLERVRLRIIGEVPDRAYAESLREKASTIPGLQFQMYGEYSRSDLSLLLRGVDCLIAPSLVPEAGPIAPLEAFSLGIPVLASRLGALPELIEEGENGFTFEPSRRIDLAAILGRLWREENLLPRLKSGARRSRVLTSAQHAARVRAVYESAIDIANRNPAAPAYVEEFKFLHDMLARSEHHRASRPEIHESAVTQAARALGTN